MGYKDALGTLLSLSLFLSLPFSLSLALSLSLCLPPRGHQPFSCTPSPACARISGRSNRLCQIIDLYLRSPESGGL